MKYIKLKNLVQETANIVIDHNKAVRDKGEDFNLFSILGMESNETKTHSAMLVALLDPKGNHYQNEKFLELFLTEIRYDYKNENLKLVIVKAEHYLGKISKDYTSGGFIDLLITFPSGKAIAIENKIYAGDQPKQMFRYSLYKGDYCTLYYLNLFGKEPSPKSLSGLGSDDYTVITYKKNILTWLDQCLSIVKSGSIIENVIKQYQILIKKLTNSMDKNLENKLNELIINNLEEAKFINSNYQKAIDGIREKLRSAIVNRINEEKYLVKASFGRDVTTTYSQVWIATEELTAKGIQFGLESFSGKGHYGGRVFVGVFDGMNDYEILKDGDARLIKLWPVVRIIKTPENNPLNLSSTKILEKLSNDSFYFDEMVKAVVNQTMDFIGTYSEQCKNK